MSDPKRTLTTKLAEVMKAVERIPKNGRNDFHKYDYATEADIVSAIRGELASRNVMLLPAVISETRHPVGDKGSVLTSLEMSMEFKDGDSGESIVKPWRGYGTDKEDKGGYKAMTGGEKYFLLKTFLIPTGDDPEQETPQTARRTEQARPQPPRQSATPPPSKPAATPVQVITDTQRQHLATIAHDAGWKNAEVKNLLVTRYGISSSQYIPVAQFDEIAKLLQAGVEVGAK